MVILEEVSYLYLVLSKFGYDLSYEFAFSLGSFINMRMKHFVALILVGGLC